MNSLNKKNRKFLWYAEAVMWLIPLVVCILVMAPIMLKLQSYQYFWTNILFVFMAITYMRWIFLLNYSPYRKSLIAFGIIAVSQPVVIFAIFNMLAGFQRFVDNIGMFEIVKTIPDIDTATSISQYIRSEMLFFGVMSIIGGIILIVRMIVAAWRIKNGHTTA